VLFILHFAPKVNVFNHSEPQLKLAVN
jgi:hypothetical protein